MGEAILNAGLTQALLQILIILAQTNFLDQLGTPKCNMLIFTLKYGQFIVLILQIQKPKALSSLLTLATDLSSTAFFLAASFLVFVSKNF